MGLEPGRELRQRRGVPPHHQQRAILGRKPVPEGGDYVIGRFFLHLTPPKMADKGGFDGNNGLQEWL